MHLKRDTDYALRILQYMVRYSERGEGITLRELCKRTGVPKTIAERLCEKMVDAKLLIVLELADMLSGDTEQKLDSLRRCYLIDKNALEKTLFDVIQIIEGSGLLFIIFDRSTELYGSCKDYFEQIERILSDKLNEICIRDLSGDIRVD